jgi:predicted permease
MIELGIALRRLARRPSFTLPAITTLAVGIGATTAIFSTVNAALLKPLPYPEAENIYALSSARSDGGWSNGFVSNAELTAILGNAPSVTAAAGMSGGEGTDVLVMDDGRNRRVIVRVVTDGFFNLAGLPLAMGRATAIEGDEGSYGAVVLSYQIWEQVYGSDPNIVGETLRFPAASATIVGVASPEFDLPAGTDLWEIFAPSATADTKSYMGFVRLSAGSTVEVLRDELGAVMATRVEGGLVEAGSTFAVTPLVDSIVGDLGPLLWIMLAAATVLLVLGCANVAALILARGGARIREVAVRKALGASRGRISRQMFTEALLLSAFGTALGLLLAVGGLRVLSVLSVESLPRLDRVPFDLNVLTAAVVTMVATALAVGLLPRARVARLDVRALLGQGSPAAPGGRGSWSVLSGLVVAEIAMAVLLVTSAGWLVRSYANLYETDPGFIPESRLVFQTMLVGSSYMPVERLVHSDNYGIGLVPRAGGGTPQAWLRELEARLAELDEFRAVGMGSVAPFRTESPAVVYAAVPGRDYDPSAPDLARVRFATPDFFQALGVRFLVGRAFSDADPQTAVVVNQAFVRAYLAGASPLGVTFETGGDPAELTTEYTILGVVADVRYSSLREPDAPAFYLRDYLPTQHVVVSTSLSDPTSLVPAVREALDAVAPGIPVNIEPLSRRMSSELARHFLGSLLMGLFAGGSLLLAGIGIHGVVGHGTSLRSKEFAVRIAVGASPSNIAGSVLRRGAALWTLGIGIGLTLAYVGGRIGAGWLYQVEAADPLILAAAVSAVSVLTLTAFFFAAVRGSQVQPGVALNSE